MRVTHHVRMRLYDPCRPVPTSPGARKTRLASNRSRSVSSTYFLARAIGSVRIADRCNFAATKLLSCEYPWGETRSACSYRRSVNATNLDLPTGSEDETVRIQAIHRVPVECFPSPYSVMQCEVKKPENRVVNFILLD